MLRTKFLHIWPDPSSSSAFPTRAACQWLAVSLFVLSLEFWAHSTPQHWPRSRSSLSRRLPLAVLKSRCDLSYLTRIYKWHSEYFWPLFLDCVTWRRLSNACTSQECATKMWKHQTSSLPPMAPLSSVTMVLWFLKARYSTRGLLPTGQRCAGCPVLPMILVLRCNIIRCSLWSWQINL